MSLSLRVLKEEFQVYFVFAEFQQFTFLSCLCTSTLPLPLSQLPLLTDESNDLQDKEGKLMFMFAQKGEMHFLSTDITKNKKTPWPRAGVLCSTTQQVAKSEQISLHTM